MKPIFLRLCAVRSTLTLSVVFVSVIFFNASPAAEAKDDAQLEIIRDGYIQSITSIRNVWCRYEFRRELADPKSNLSGPKAVNCEWATEGEKFHYSFSPIPAETEAGRHHRPWWESTDGKDFWRLEYTEQDKIDHALKWQLRDGTWQMRYKLSPGQFLGLYFNVGKYNTRGLTLQSILETVPLKLVGAETIDGHQCWQVDFDYPGERPVHDIPMTVFFDPAANYLPRRLIQHSTSGGDPTIRTVLEFSQVKGGEGQSVYFPVKMRDDHPIGLSRLEVLEVKLNEKLPETLYRPQIPAGVEVYDVDKDRDVQALRRKRSEAKRKKNERLKSETAEKSSRADKTSPSTSGEPVVDARPSTLNYSVIVLVTGGLLMLSITTYSYWFAKK